MNAHSRSLSSQPADLAVRATSGFVTGVTAFASIGLAVAAPPGRTGAALQNVSFDPDRLGLRIRP
jgi:hypothetical protein